MKKSILSLSLSVFAIATALSFGGCKKELDFKEPGNLVPKTVDQDLTLPAITVNNTRLHSETFGNPDSPIVVILHGGPGGDYRSLLNCRQLADNGYFVVFYDQRGSGLSQRHSKNTYSTEIMFDDLSAVISHYRRSATQKVFLFGHSWGAILATGYINKYPGAVNGVVLAEPGGFNSNDVKDYVARTRELKPFNESDNDAVYPDQFITGNENDHEILDYKFALYAAHGSGTGDKGIAPFWRYGAVVQSSLFEIADRDGFDWTANLNQFHTKVLFLYSERNTAYGLDYAQRLSSAYPNVQLNVINGCGHEMIEYGWSNTYPLTLSYFNSLR